jgi:nucleotide-binding universal stress UspA family protein
MRALLALDLRDHPDAVLADAARWAARLDATLDLLWVDDTPAGAAFVTDPAIAAVVTREAERHQRQHRDHLDALLAGLPRSARGEALVATGDPAEAVAELASGHDVLLVATHGRQGLAHAWLGSVAERIARLATVPVLVLRVPHP